MEDLEISCCDNNGNSVDLGSYVENMVVVDLYCDGEVGTVFLDLAKARKARDWLNQWIEEQEKKGATPSSNCGDSEAARQ